MDSENLVSISVFRKKYLQIPQSTLRKWIRCDKFYFGDFCIKTLPGKSNPYFVDLMKFERWKRMYPTLWESISNFYKTGKEPSLPKESIFDDLRNYIFSYYSFLKSLIIFIEGLSEEDRKKFGKGKRA